MEMNRPFLVAPGRERPDLTLFDFPDATLNDGSAEEIEFDQALSLAGRFGRDFLGVQIDGLVDPTIVTEWQTQAAATDFDMFARFTLSTRTGAFVYGDPELIWARNVMTAKAGVTSGVTDPVLAWEKEESQYGEPFLYVAPRLFWRFANDLNYNAAVGDFDVRMASISVRLTFPIFIELLERFADVTLL